MKVAVILLVAMVMMMNQDVDAWWKRRAGRIAIRLVPGGRTISRGIKLVRKWGKREVTNTDEFDVAYNAAAEDGVFTDEEIQSVFGKDENGLADFKEMYDLNEDGVVHVEEYEIATTIAANM